MKNQYKLILSVIFSIFFFIFLFWVNILFGIINLDETLYISPGTYPLTDPYDPNLMTLITFGIPIIMCIGLIMKYIPQKEISKENKEVNKE